MSTPKISEADRKAQSKRDKAAHLKAKAALTRAERAPRQSLNRPYRGQDRHDQQGPRTGGNFMLPFKTQIPGVIAGSTNFAAYTLSINPGDPNIDPRLALMSQAWSRFKFRNLKARWVPLGSAFSAANQTGEVVINFNANWYSAYSSTVSMATEKGPAKLGDAWKSFSVKCTADILGPKRTLRSNWGSNAMDMRTTDILMEVIVAGTPNTSNIGYVELSGDCEFFDAYVQNTTIAPRTNKLFAVTGNGTQTLTSGVTAQIVFPYANQLPNSFNSGVQEVARTAGNTGYTVSGGTYKATVKAYVSATTITGISADINPGGASMILGGGGMGAGGTGFSCSSFTVIDDCVFTIAEDSAGTLSTDITVTGTGTITITECVFTVTPA